MRVIPTKDVLIRGKRVRQGTPIDIKLKKGFKLPRHFVPVGKEPKPEEEIATLSEMGKAPAKSGKSVKTTVT